MIEDNDSITARPFVILEILMAFYRLYFMDRRGKIARDEVVEADDDDGARREAVRLDHAYAIKIWQAERPVGTVLPLTGAG
jgi:hypothetical protein